MTVALHPPARRKLNRWVQAVYDAWLDATLSWEAQREAAAVGYDTEMKEFEHNNPRPRLRDFMVHMSHGQEQEVA